jgi:hypothetical protein
VVELHTFRVTEVLLFQNQHRSRPKELFSTVDRLEGYKSEPLPWNGLGCIAGISVVVHAF